METYASGNPSGSAEWKCRSKRSRADYGLAHHAAPVPKNMGRNAMTYGHRLELLQHDLPSDRIRPLPLKRAEDRAMNRDAMAAVLLRPPTVRRLAELLRPLPVRERTTILAQVVREGTMTRAGADQILIAIVLEQNGLSVR